MQGKKFRFSLASVLRLRQHETKKTKQDLAKKMQDRRAQEQEVTEARDNLSELSPALNAETPVSVNLLRRREAHFEAARQMLQKASERLADLELEERKTRKALLQKKSAEESLLTLQDQEKEHHIRGIENAENKQIEEQALDNYRRQQLSNET